MIDLSSPDTFVDGVPYSYFAELRRDDPIHWQPEVDGPGYWAVTRYTDVVKFYRDWQRFSSARGSAQMHNYDEGTLGMIRRMLPNMDPPEHSSLRRLFMSWLTPNMKAMAAGVDTIVHEAIADIGDRDHIDFLDDFARYIPVKVIGQIMGVPESDYSLMFAWCDRLANATDALGSGGVEAAMEVIDYTSHLAERYRRSPEDNLLSTLVNEQVDMAEPIWERRYLSDLEVGLQFLAMLVGGNETTRQAMCWWVLGSNHDPNAWRMLKLDLRVIPNAIEETLRWGSPVLGGRRTATEDIEDTPIKEGDKVFLYYVSANHDEAIFEAPNRFIAGRHNARKHTSFGGWGPHRCFGAAITHFEMESTIRALVGRFEHIKVDGFVPRLRSNFFNAVEHLPVLLVR